jgi:hypothetical protein
MRVSVPALVPIAGSVEAAQNLVEVLVDLKKHMRAQLAAIRESHAQEFAEAKRQAEAAHSALKEQHGREIEALQRELAAARKQLAEVPELRRRLQACAFASEQLAAALKVGT